MSVTFSDRQSQVLEVQEPVLVFIRLSMHNNHNHFISEPPFIVVLRTRSAATQTLKSNG